MLKFQRKLVELEIIEAIQITNATFDDPHPNPEHIVSSDVVYDPKHRQVHINTPMGHMVAQLGDWIIKGIRGEYYPCKPDIFETTYEVVPGPVFNVVDKLRRCGCSICTRSLRDMGS